MRGAKLLALLAVLVAAGGGLWGWWRWSAAHPSTDDATLQAGIVTIAPLVGGRVAEVSVRENQHVRRGDLLFRLDAAALTAARDMALARLDEARQGAASADDATAGAAAALAGAAAVRAQAETEFAREDALFRAGNVAEAALDQARATRDQAVAAEQAASAALASAKEGSGPTDADAAVRAAAAALQMAELDLAHATVVAPADGWVSNLSLRVGEVVAPSQGVFALVEDGEWWVEANFKETDLARIQPGDPARVTLDMYPDLTLAAAVESLGAGSGAVFSLLPPENATGNWVKVTQRFPVRIRLDESPADPHLPLRAGASATVRVDTDAEAAP